MDEPYETIDYCDGDGDPSLAGYYIVMRDADGDQYDAIGPYVSQEEAEHIQAMTTFDEAA